MNVVFSCKSLAITSTWSCLNVSNFFNLIVLCPKCWWLLLKVISNIMPLYSTRNLHVERFWSNCFLKDILRYSVSKYWQISLYEERESCIYLSIIMIILAPVILYCYWVRNQKNQLTCSSHRLDRLEASESSLALWAGLINCCHLEPSSPKHASQTRWGFLYPVMVACNDSINVLS